jgi:hypothetical protein
VPLPAPVEGRVDGLVAGLVLGRAPLPAPVEGRVDGLVLLDGRDEDEGRETFVPVAGLRRALLLLPP